MRRSVQPRIVAQCRKGGAAGRATLVIVRMVGQVKSACHERPKPLTKLGFYVAGGSVACKGHEFGQGIQGLGVAGASWAARGVRR